MPAKLRVTLVKSPISHNPTNRATVRALGLHRIGDTIEIDDTPALRGMVRAVRFLLVTEEIDAAESASVTTAAEPAAAAKRQTKEKAK